MATEDDKTNTGVAGTAIAVGVAAMIAGSTALVGMARTEIEQVSDQTQGYADLNSVKELKSEQDARLASAKLSIDKARQLTLSKLKSDPDQASPWTPKPPPPEASSAAAATSDVPSSASAETATSASVEVQTSAAPSGAAGTEAAPATSATDSN
jgi:hypothetical protein